MFKQYVSIFHPNRIQDDFLFYTNRKGVTVKMSPDNVARILNIYEKAVKAVNPELPHLHPHLFHHARAFTVGNQLNLCLCRHRNETCCNR